MKWGEGGVVVEEVVVVASQGDAMVL